MKEGCFVTAGYMGEKKVVSGIVCIDIVISTIFKHDIDHSEKFFCYWFLSWFFNK